MIFDENEKWVVDGFASKATNSPFLGAELTGSWIYGFDMDGGNMKDVILQLVMAFVGSLGFAMLFHLRRSLWVTASLGGLFCWGCYLLA